MYDGRGGSFLMTDSSIFLLYLSGFFFLLTINERIKHLCIARSKSRGSLARNVSQ